MLVSQGSAALRAAPAMEVSPQLKGLNHAPAIGHVGQQPQLQLAVVSNNQRLGRLSAERLAHLSTVPGNRQGTK
jgi:hypothetical protein